jgi:hypothetical protein
MSFASQQKSLGIINALADNKNTKKEEKETRPSNVLTEEEYVESLESIIQRDFFPSLPELRAQVDMELPSNRQGAKRKDIQELTLDEFESKYLNEDSVSFNNIIKTQNELHREKYKWIYENNQLKLLTSSEKGKIAYVKPKHLISYPEGIGSNLLNDVSGPSKSIIHQNTRLIAPQQTVNEDSSSYSDRLSAVNSYEMVETTPSIFGDDDATPQLTWGTLDATPVLLDHGNHGQYFKIPEVPKREIIAKKLSDNATRKIVDREKRSSQSPRTSLSPSVRNTQTPQGLSPAAQTLLKNLASPRHLSLTPRTPTSGFLTSPHVGQIKKRKKE